MKEQRTRSEANEARARPIGLDSFDRRVLLRLSGAAALAAAAKPVTAATTGRPQVCIYTEHFQSLPIPQVCKVFQKIGVDGLDLTVRPGGHIDPRDVVERLPRAVEAAREHGLEVMMLTTNITAPDGRAEAILKTCQRLNIDRIKMGYYAVGEFGKLTKRMDEVRRSLEAVAKLAAKYDVRPCVHVHSGSTIPSSGVMLYEIIREMPPDRIGAYLDSHHMTITGGAGGWRQAIDLLKPWISLVALKNFQWDKSARDEIGQQRWRTNYCRLADGIAPIPDFVRTVQRAGYRGFFTLHTEYRLPVDDCIKWTADDFTFLKRVFARG
ncbi:MAG: TIM barrel protein [Pirellulaceae bacterium]|jgi:sugar phosphate isomerase/epimerase|nr:TIM barrel protein [Pirellulaceae bacterium]MDP7015166.1 TIM barrel protein [Pirellulaceae bacterium]